jgi:outer membrane autotransporter protein
MIRATCTHICNTILRGGRLTKFKGIAASIAPMMGAGGIAALTAGQALAEDECGVDLPGGSTTTCTTGSYASGIAYDVTDGADFTLILNDPGIVVGPVSDAGSLAASGVTGFGVIAMTRMPTGAVTINATNFGTVSTSGYRGDAILAYIPNTGNDDDATATMSSGEVVTTGAFAFGLRSQNNSLGNSTTIFNGGKILTRGYNSFGLASFVPRTDSQSIATSIMNGGSIETRGDRGFGMLAQNKGMETVRLEINGGKILTLGAASHGAIAYTDNINSSADAIITMAGQSIDTKGAGSTGLATLTKGSGESIIDVVRGDIRTNGTESHGLWSRASGSGDVRVSVKNDAQVSTSGMNSDGIKTQVYSAGSSYDASVDGTASVTSGGGDGVGIRTISVSDSSGAVSVGVDATIDGSSGAAAILDEGGDIIVKIAGTVIGDVSLGNGSDTLEFNETADMSGVGRLVGGTEVMTTDKLTMRGQTFSSTGANIANWETLIVDGGHLSLVDKILKVGSDAGEGLLLTNGGTLNAAGGLALTGNLTNNGTVTTLNDLVGDVITVSGDYTGTGVLLLDVNTATNSADNIVISGDLLGDPIMVQARSTTPRVPLTGDIVLVTVEGISTDGSVVGNLESGAFDYSLEKKDGDFMFSAASKTINSKAAVYETLPAVMTSLNQVGTLAQRIKGRQMLVGVDSGAASRDAENSAPLSTRGTLPQLLKTTGVWMRIDSDRLNVTPETSTAGVLSFDQSAWRLQGGVDMVAYETYKGTWVAGLNLFTGGSTVDVNHGVSSSMISTEARGVGLTGTFYGNNGFYADAQLRHSDFKSDLSSKLLGSIASDINGSGRLASLELGQTVVLSNDRTLTPQAQLTWSDVDFDSFSGKTGEQVSIGDNDSFQIRLGLVAKKSWELGNGRLANLYGIANVTREMRGNTSALVDGTEVSMSAPEWLGEVGIGGSYGLASTAGRRTSIYGEVTASKALTGGEITGLAGSIGFHMQW